MPGTTQIPIAKHAMNLVKYGGLVRGLQHAQTGGGLNDVAEGAKRMTFSLLGKMQKAIDLFDCNFDIMATGIYNKLVGTGAIKKNAKQTGGGYEEDLDALKIATGKLAGSDLEKVLNLSKSADHFRELLQQRGNNVFFKLFLLTVRDNLFGGDKFPTKKDISEYNDKTQLPTKRFFMQGDVNALSLNDAENLYNAYTLIDQEVIDNEITYPRGLPNRQITGQSVKSLKLYVKALAKLTFPKISVGGNKNDTAVYSVDHIEKIYNGIVNVSSFELYSLPSVYYRMLEEVRISQEELAKATQEMNNLRAQGVPDNAALIAEMRAKAADDVKIIADLQAQVADLNSQIVNNDNAEKIAKLTAKRDEYLEVIKKAEATVKTRNNTIAELEAKITEADASHAAEKSLLQSVIDAKTQEIAKLTASLAETAKLSNPANNNLIAELQADVNNKQQQINQLNIKLESELKDSFEEINALKSRNDEENKKWKNFSQKYREVIMRIAKKIGVDVPQFIDPPNAQNYTDALNIFESLENKLMECLSRQNEASANIAAAVEKEILARSSSNMSSKQQSSASASSSSSSSSNTYPEPELVLELENEDGDKYTKPDNQQEDEVELEFPQESYSGDNESLNRESDNYQEELVLELEHEDGDKYTKPDNQQEDEVELEFPQESYSGDNESLNRESDNHQEEMELELEQENGDKYTKPDNQQEDEVELEFENNRINQDGESTASLQDKDEYEEKYSTRPAASSSASTHPAAWRANLSFTNPSSSAAPVKSYASAASSSKLSTKPTKTKEMLEGDAAEWYKKVSADARQKFQDEDFAKRMAAASSSSSAAPASSSASSTVPAGAASLAMYQRELASIDADINGNMRMEDTPSKQENITKLTKQKDEVLKKIENLKAALGVQTGGAPSQVKQRRLYLA